MRTLSEWMRDHQIDSTTVSTDRYKSNPSYDGSPAKTQDSDEQIVQRIKNAMCPVISIGGPQAAKPVALSDANIISLIQKSTDKARALMGKDQKLINSFLGSDNSSLYNTFFDAVINHVENVDVARSIVKKRFDVWVGSDGCTDNELLETLENVKKIIVQYCSDFLTKGSDKIEYDWTLGGVRHLYQCYLRMPTDQVKAVKLAITTNNTDGIGGISFKDTGITVLNYKADQIDEEKEDTKFSDENDANFGQNAADLTFTHEFGHAVDNYIGPKVMGKDYSQTEEFQSLSGWKQLSYGQTDDATMLNVAQFIGKYHTNPYPENLNSETGKKYVNLVGAKIAASESNEDSKHEKAALDVLDEIYKGVYGTIIKNTLVTELKDYYNFGFSNVSDYSSVSLDDEFSKYSDYEDKFNKYSSYSNSILAPSAYAAVSLSPASEETSEPVLSNATESSASKPKSKDLNEAMKNYKEVLFNYGLIKHIRETSVGKKANMNAEPYSYMPEYQVHADYHGDWWAYKTEKRNSGKISRYQFTNATEEFAELYSNYFVSADKDGNGRKTPEYLKTWFEKRVVKEIKPGVEDKIPKVKDPDPRGPISI